MPGALHDFLHKPIDKDAYRTIGVTAGLSVLFIAALVFASEPRWELAAIAAIFALPAGLVGGVLVVVWKSSQLTLPPIRSTVYRQGLERLLVVLAGLWVTQLVIGRVIWWQTTGISSRESSEIAFVLIWGSVLVWILVVWLYGRQAGGDCLLDCGPNPYGRSALPVAVVLVTLGLMDGIAAGSSATAYHIASSVLLALTGAFWLFMAGGRLQVRENGVWQCWKLFGWDRIESYRWADDGTLLVKVRGLPFFRLRALPVPSEYRDAFDQLLQKHGVVEDKEGG